MTSETIVIDFKALTTLTNDKITEAIPLSRAVQATIDAYNADEVSSCEIYMCWTTSLFQKYGPTSINNTDLTKLLDIFSSAIDGLLNECQKQISEEQNDKLSTFLNYSMELFNWIRSVAKDFETNQITVFICFGLSIVNNYLLVISKQTGQMFVNKLLEKCVALQALVLNILSESSENFNFSTNDACQFNTLISHLCSVGELTPKVDIKMTVETWKCVTKLASQNILQTQAENWPLDDIDWLKKPMSFLIKEIGSNVRTVYQENSLSEPIQQIEKYLKVTNFYLRLFEKLTISSRHVPFPVCEDFLNTFAVLFNRPKHIENTPVDKAVMENITKGFRELIPFAYKNELFWELLLKESGDIKTYDAFDQIFMEVMNLMQYKWNDMDYINHKVVEAFFARCPSTTILLPTSTYNMFIETMTSLLIFSRSEQFQETLIKSVLQDDILLAFIAIDIWCTAFMCSDHTTRMSYFKFWRDINENFAKFSDQLSAFYVQILLNNFYMFLTAEEKSEIWNSFDVFALTNDRFLLTIGLDQIPNIPEKKSIIQHFVEKLQRFLSESSSNMTVDSFYTIVKGLKLLTPIDFQNDEIIEMLLEYLEIAMKNKKFSLLFESILDFLASKLQFIDDNKILKILTDVSMELPTFEDYSVKLSLIGFLKEVSKNVHLKKHSEEILKIVASDELSRHLGNIENPTGEGEDSKINENLLLEILKSKSTKKINRVHVCRLEEEGKEEELHVKKKMKPDTKFLLESLEHEVDKLHSNVQFEKLNASNVEIINRIVRKLQAISTLS